MKQLRLLVLLILFPLALCQPDSDRELKWARVETTGTLPVATEGAILEFAARKFVYFGGDRECVNVTVNPTTNVTSCINVFYNTTYVLDGGVWSIPPLNSKAPAIENWASVA